MRPPDEEADTVTIGVVLRPHGIKGEVVVEPLTDNEDRYGSLEEVRVVRPSGIASSSKCVSWTVGLLGHSATVVDAAAGRAGTEVGAAQCGLVGQFQGRHLGAGDGGQEVVGQGGVAGQDRAVQVGAYRVSVHGALDRTVAEVLTPLGMTMHAKTSGSKGMQLYATPPEPMTYRGDGGTTELAHRLAVVSLSGCQLF